MKDLVLYVKLDDMVINNSNFVSIKEYYNNLASSNKISKYQDDSGLDLPAPMDTEGNLYDVKKINFLISCMMVDTKTGETLPYYLYPRSSISKYPLMLANSVGIIDKNYRGNLGAPTRFFAPFVIEKNMKLYQICSSDLTPFKIKLVSELPSTERGANGFGSTG
uniref:dUTPase-like domain-containing protein n=1 Tax=Megaviridae environmental sample TaxID=1737588 RepID=A0A5J6VKC2_9VIRU|nr:MAG: hypothetical protein [Megaviridae environmental sample]